MVPDDPRRDAAGSTNPFDFDDPAPTPPDDHSRSGSTRGRSGSPTGPSGSGNGQSGSHSEGFDPFGLDAAAHPTGRPRTGQRLSWAAVIMVLVGALAIGLGIGGALTSIRLEASSPFGSVLWWGTLTLIGVLIILVALISAIIGVVQAEPRRIAVIALVASVLLGWIAAYIGFRIGAHHLTLEAVRVVGAKGPQAVPAIEHYLQQRGIDAGAYTGLLHRVFG